MPFPPDAHFPQRAPDAADRFALQGLSLLVVDDSRYTCDALRLILQRAGARLRRAESLEIARLHLAFLHPDLAVVDLGLPDGRGEDLIAEVSELGIPVMGISGDPAGRVRALDAGAAGFIDKPIGSVAGFIRLIRQLVTGAGALDKGEDPPTPPGDPMALRDDLTRAAALISAPSDPAYALAFVQSLARATGDRALEAAARTAHTAFDQALLGKLIEERLNALQTLA